MEMRTKDDTDDIITKLLESFLENYEREENILRNGSGYVFDSVDLTLVQFHSIQLKRDSSYIPSPKWIEKKKATIYPQNTKDDYCFAYSIVATLHHEEIDKNPHRIKTITTGKKEIFPQDKKTGKRLRETTKTLLLTSFLPTLLIKNLS